MKEVSIINNLDNPDYVVFTPTNWEEVYAEYYLALKKIRKYKRWMQEQIKEIQEKGDNGRRVVLDKEMMEYRTVVNDSEKEMIENIMNIEIYLPFEKRYFSNREYDRLYKLTMDKTSDYGYKPENKTKQEKEDDLFISNNMQIFFNNMLRNVLTDRQYQCIKMYYGENIQQDKIAEKLGIERSTVAVHIRDAIAKIKQSDVLVGLLNK